MGHLKLLAWNVKTGNKYAAEAVAAMVRWYQPDVVVIQEAAFMARDLARVAMNTGYVLYQERPGSWREPVSERGETAVMVREEHTIQRSWVRAMKQRWVGPVNDWTHEPRRYRRLRIKVRRTTWRVSAEHWPTGGLAGHNGLAVRETLRSARAWLRVGILTRTVLVGDLNTPTKTLRRWFPKCQVKGAGPDNLMARGCLAERTVLEKHGSDHPAMLYVIKGEK